MRYLIVLAMVLTLAMSVFAQPDPNGGDNAAGAPPAGGPGGGGRQGQGMRGMNGMMGGMMGALGSSSLEILPEGVFVLERGVLAKFDAANLNAAGMLELFGTLAAQPKLSDTPTTEERTAMREWMTQNMQRSAPAAMLPGKGKLYIVIGTKYFLIDLKTMTADVKADLITADPAAAANPFAAFTGGTPVLKLADGVLYVITNQQLLAVNPATGQVQNRAKLPKQMEAPNMGFGGMGGGARNGGGGGNRNGGNRNGGGGAAPAAPVAAQ